MWGCWEQLCQWWCFLAGKLLELGHTPTCPVKPTSITSMNRSNRQPGFQQGISYPSHWEALWEERPASTSQDQLSNSFFWCRCSLTTNVHLNHRYHFWVRRNSWKVGSGSSKWKRPKGQRQNKQNYGTDPTKSCRFQVSKQVSSWRHISCHTDKNMIYSPLKLLKCIEMYR